MNTYEVFGGSRDGELLKVPRQVAMDEELEIVVRNADVSNVPSPGARGFLRTEIYKRQPGSRLVYVGRPPVPEPEGY